MRSAARQQPQTAPETVRCAVYTRKSTTDGLEQEFNSLDAQREACAAFIKSQAGLGWQLVEESYADGGFTGGNLERPALRQLMEDIESGDIDCVIVYKIDRLSRSLLDFSRLIEVFDHYGVAFVSVTQQFNTGSSTGRLMLNILLSFAQFEREMIAERTKDKMQAARRKGRWTGGPPMLGYDVHPAGGKLIVNEPEAEQVRQLYRWYLQHRSLSKVSQLANSRGWRTKSWTTKEGKQREGKPWDRGVLHRHLTNAIYLGKVRPCGELMDGLHPAIIDEATFWKAQEVMKANRTTGGSATRNRHGAILRGLLHCKLCGQAMGFTFTQKKGRLYRYYACNKALKNGRTACSAQAIPAGEIEAFIADRLRALGSNQQIVEATTRQMQQERESQRRLLLAEKDRAQRDRERASAKLAKAADQFSAGILSAAEAESRINKCRQEIAALDTRLEALSADLARSSQDDMEVSKVRTLLGDFDKVWEVLIPAERHRIIELLIERIEVDSASGKIAIQFHPEGLRLLGANECSREAVQ